MAPSPEAVPRAARPAASASAVLSYREALRQVMHQALATHPHALVIGQGVDDHKAIFGSTAGLAHTFGRQRVIDTPLAEEGMTGIAIGAALNGAYPIQTHIRVDFALLAMNQIVNLAAKMRYMFGGRFELPMLIRLVIGRSWGQGGQHSQSLQSLFAHIPGLIVIMPSTSRAVLDYYPHIIATCRNPVLTLEHRLLYDLEFQLEPPLATTNPSPLSARLMRRGRDVTVVATSIMVLEAMRAAEHLARHAGIECEVIDLNCISHPDAEMILQSVASTGKLLVADTSWPAYGVCAEICRLVSTRAPASLNAPVATIGMAPATCPTAKSLEDLYYPNLSTLTDAVAALVTGRRDHGIAMPEERSMADVYKRFKGPF